MANEIKQITGTGRGEIERTYKVEIIRKIEGRTAWLVKINGKYAQLTYSDWTGYGAWRMNGTRTVRLFTNGYVAI